MSVSNSINIVWIFSLFMFLSCENKQTQKKIALDVRVELEKCVTMFERPFKTSIEMRDSAFIMLVDNKADSFLLLEELISSMKDSLKVVKEAEFAYPPYSAHYNAHLKEHLFLVSCLFYEDASFAFKRDIYNVDSLIYMQEYEQYYEMDYGLPSTITTLQALNWSTDLTLNWVRQRNEGLELNERPLSPSNLYWYGEPGGPIKEMPVSDLFN